MGDRPPGLIGRPSRIYESFHESRCPACGDWIRSAIFRFHIDLAHGTEPRELFDTYDVREISLPDRIVEYVEAGNYLEAAAGACGVDASAVRDWIRWGSEWHEPGIQPEEIPDDRQVFASFASAIKEARESASAMLVRRIERAAQDPRYWTAAAWLLERTRPMEYARQDRLRLGGDPGAGPIRVESNLTDEQVTERLRATVEILQEVGMLPVSAESNGRGNGTGTDS